MTSCNCPCLAINCLTNGKAITSLMMPAARCRSGIVSNRGMTISSHVLSPPPPAFQSVRSKPVSFCSSNTSSKSDTVSVCEMM